MPEKPTRSSQDFLEKIKNAVGGAINSTTHLQCKDIGGADSRSSLPDCTSKELLGLSLLSVVSMTLKS